MKAPLSFMLTLAALAVVKLDTPEEASKHVAGSEVSVPCNLKGPRLTWYWIPSYPRCADIKGNGKKAICSLISNQTYKEPKNRFELRSDVKKQNGNSSAILTFRALYMNDSGHFYCSNGKRESPKVPVTVKSGSQNGIVAHYFKEPHLKHWRANLTCNSCEDKTHAKVNQEDTITWTLNGGHVPNEICIQKLGNILQIKINPRKSYGLWKCSDPVCPRQSDGYCLESDPETLEESVNKKTSLFTPTPPGKAVISSYVIGGVCVTGLLVLLLVGAAVFVTCRKHQSSNLSSSETTREPEAQGSKHSTVPEGFPERRDGEARTVDHNSTVRGSEGIQYSTLEFMETDGLQIQTDKETVTYAELCANN